MSAEQAHVDDADNQRVHALPIKNGARGGLAARMLLVRSECELGASEEASISTGASVSSAD